ncbi:four helix bundle protein [Dyadobacter sp. BHUBP1]|uniref:four helix bundle protein n=1 Tax=Dyadobacter sp. BHUBP1 TaxID=3424178 RepID=UPI003D32E13C
MQNYHELKVWQKSHALVLEIYKMTDLLPKSETFGLISQMRRSSVSIAANLAEGCGKKRNA